MGDQRSLRQKLLASTIENAAGIPFYRDFWAGVQPKDIESIDDLPRLPLLSKAQYRSDLMFSEHTLRDTALISHTTGTTGKLTWRHRSIGEVSVIQKLFGLANTHTDAPDDPPLSLVLQYGRHGNAMPMPGNARTFPIALADDTELSQAVSALGAHFYYGGKACRPTALCGGVQYLAVLAQACLERGLKQGLHDIRRLHVLGYTDPGLYGFMMRAFDSPLLIENFSMAEVFGGAQRLWPDGHFVLDPYVIGEVVSENGRHVAEGQVGELVLTELFPFVQMQPLIRYQTGDIVKLVRKDTEHNLQFDWLGRRNDCILQVSKNKPVWALTFRPISDWLSMQPVVARENRLVHLNVQSCDFGSPCLRIFRDEVAETICLDIGLRVNPWLSKRLTGDFVGSLWTKLREMFEETADVPIRISLVDGRNTLVFGETGDRPRLVLPATSLSEPPPSC